MSDTGIAKIFMHGRSQAVRLPLAFRLPGDRVRVRNHNPTTHTRLPGYLRGKVGLIEQDYGVFAFPDTHAHGLGEKPQHCYSVRFTAREVWGPSASDRDTLRVDVFDDYMDLD